MRRAPPLPPACPRIAPRLCTCMRAARACAAGMTSGTTVPSQTTEHSPAQRMAGCRSSPATRSGPGRATAKTSLRCRKAGVRAQVFCTQLRANRQKRWRGSVTRAAGGVPCRCGFDPSRGKGSARAGSTTVDTLQDRVYRKPPTRGPVAHMRMPKRVAAGRPTRAASRRARLARPRGWRCRATVHAGTGMRLSITPANQLEPAGMALSSKS